MPNVDLSLDEENSALLTRMKGRRQERLRPFCYPNLQGDLPAESSQYSPRRPTKLDKIKNLYAEVRSEPIGKGFTPTRVGITDEVRRWP